MLTMLMMLKEVNLASSCHINREFRNWLLLISFYVLITTVSRLSRNQGRFQLSEMLVILGGRQVAGATNL